MSTVADLKARRLDLLQRVSEVEAVLRQLGVRPGAKTGAARAPRRKGGGNPMQAAHDAIAVKRGTATPEQLKRYQARQKAKGGAAPKRPTKRTPRTQSRTSSGHGNTATAAARPRLQRRAPAQGASLAAAAEG